MTSAVATLPSTPSLSRKITVGYYAVAVLLAVAAMLVWHELTSLEHRVRLGELTTQLQEITLEVRRFERNFFLHRLAADQNENRQALQRARGFLTTHHDALASPDRETSLRRLQTLLADYQQRMDRYAATPLHNTGALDTAEKQVRDTGREIVAIADGIAGNEQQALRASLRHFRLLLLAGIAVLAAFIVVLGQGIARRIVSPLKAMEQRVQRLSHEQTGRMAPPTRDREIVAVTEAFNQMLHELEARQHHLLRSEKLASMGTLLSGVAHELNNPLSNISTSCQILLEEWQTLDATSRAHWLAQIDAQCDRARDIVRALLDFARNRPFQREAVPLRELVTQTLQFMRGNLGSGITVDCRVDATLAVAGDPRRLQQALLNLFTNAVQAMAGAGTLRISARATTVTADDDASQPPFSGCTLTGEVIDIAIMDTGPGIAPEALPHLFDPFFTTKEVGKGMGLGLFITHEIVEQHDGCIAATTAPGGATFHLRLPAASQLARYTSLAITNTS